MQNNNPARNLPWFSTAVAEPVADQLVLVDQASRSALRHALQVEALLDERWRDDLPQDVIELIEHAQSALVCMRYVRACLEAASQAGSTVTP